MPRRAGKEPTMRALLSVADKTGIETLARGLHALGIEIISTGKTGAALTSAGIENLSVADVTGFPEILAGRVKTLHPAVHGGILARRDDEAQLAELAEHQISPIDIVVCNLYPFARVSADPHAALETVVEQIDIGGVTLLRAAAKNFAYVTVLTRPDDYPAVLYELEAGGATSMDTRRRLAILAFQHTAFYDTTISEYLRRDTAEEVMPDEFTI